MNAPLPKTMGESLATAVARRWIRECAEDINTLKQGTLHVQADNWRQRLNRARRYLEQSTSPWIQDVEDRGKRRHRRVFVTCILPWSSDPDDGLCSGGIVADSEGVSTVRTPVRFTPHALARGIQTLGRSRAALIDDMAAVADAMLEYRDRRTIVQTTTLSYRDADDEPYHWVVAWDEKEQTHVVRTAIRGAALGGRRAAKQRELDRTGASVILTRFDGSRIYQFDHEEAIQ